VDTQLMLDIRPIHLERWPSRSGPADLPRPTVL